MLKILKEKRIIIKLLVLNLIFINYEVVTFNEEFFIALGFFSFFFITVGIFSNLLKDFYLEERLKVYKLFYEQISRSSNFLLNFVEHFSLFENFREYYNRGLLLTVDYVLFKFNGFYSSLEGDDKILPEIIITFYDKLLNSVASHIEQNYISYFREKMFSVENLSSDFLGQESLNFEQKWIFSY